MSLTFVALVRRADTLRRLDRDPLHSAWWSGYIHGLRRAFHGDSFGSPADHAASLALASSPDPARAARGRGYQAGLTLTAQDPD